MNAEKSAPLQAGGKMKIMGVLTITFGVLAIASAWVAGQSIMWLVGVLVIAGGMTRMVWAFRAGSLGKGILVFLIGVLTLLAGIAVIAHPLMTSAILSVLLAVYFLADGLAEIFAGSALPAGQPGKGWLIFDGLVTLLSRICQTKGAMQSGSL
jgi:uncharacterized membrane protein HdeD (DUF308 family)